MPTLYDKLWATHVVADAGDGAALLYIDLMLLHEVSSPQAFAGLRSAGRVPRRIAPHLAVADHAVPTHDRDRPLADCHARAQVSLLEDNCKNRIAYLLSPTPGRGSSASSSAVVTLAKLSNRA